MPLHYYRRDDGALIEEFYHATEEVPEEIKCKDGIKAFRDRTAEWQRPSSRRWEGGKVLWPMKSRAMGVHPSQIGENMRRYPHLEYDNRTGEAIFESHQHRKQCVKDLGFVDFDAA